MHFSPIKIFDSTRDLVADLKALIRNRRVVVITDENVSTHCLSLILADLNEFTEVDIIETEPGEQSKSIAVCEHIWNHLLENEIGKEDLILNLGGGVVTDLGGFIASTYKRGIPFLHLPTSLLGMTDAAIGGKTGIDQMHVKNAIGTFSSPEAIWICKPFLETLPSLHLKSGFAEMLKHGLIGDAVLWQDLIALSKLTANKIAPHLAASIEVKDAIVREDYYETGERKLLNFGHTIGHAIESSFLQDQVQQGPITHGEAVAFGMMIESRISASLGICSIENSDSIVEKLEAFFPRGNFDFPTHETLMGFIMNDKKNALKKVRMSLVESPGKGRFNIEVSPEIIEQEYNKWLHAN